MMITTVAELIEALQEFNPTDRVSIVTGDEDNTEELGAFELHGRGGDYCEIFIPTPEFRERLGGLTPDEEAELASLEAAFEQAGGRGVELAERIDELRTKRDGDVRGCSCGMADYGAPGHDGHKEATDA